MWKLVVLVMCAVIVGAVIVPPAHAEAQCYTACEYQYHNGDWAPLGLDYFCCNDLTQSSYSPPCDGGDHWCWAAYVQFTSDAMAYAAGPDGPYQLESADFEVNLYVQDCDYENSEWDVPQAGCLATQVPGGPYYASGYECAPCNI
jgi:hypothetical protein